MRVSSSHASSASSASHSSSTSSSSSSSRSTSTSSSASTSSSSKSSAASSSSKSTNTSSVSTSSSSKTDSSTQTKGISQSDSSRGQGSKTNNTSTGSGSSLAGLVGGLIGGTIGMTGGNLVSGAAIGYEVAKGVYAAVTGQIPSGGSSNSGSGSSSGYTGGNTSSGSSTSSSSASSSSVASTQGSTSNAGSVSTTKGTGMIIPKNNNEFNPIPNFNIDSKQDTKNSSSNKSSSSSVSSSTTKEQPSKGSVVNKGNTNATHQKNTDSTHKAEEKNTNIISKSYDTIDKFIYRNNLYQGYPESKSSGKNTTTTNRSTNDRTKFLNHIFKKENVNQLNLSQNQFVKLKIKKSGPTTDDMIETMEGMEKDKAKRNKAKKAQEEADKLEAKKAKSEKPAITKDWLRLYSKPTVDEPGRFVAKHPNAFNYDWGMGEELQGQCKKGNLPGNARTEIKKEGKEPVVKLTSNNLYTDAEGRYWVAIGPNVMNPDHKSNEEIKAPEMKYGTKIDIVVIDEKTKKEYYIPAVVGDAKEHSYPDGLYQTGIPFDSKRKIGPKNDHNTVEFIGYDISTITVGKDKKSSVNVTNKYKLKGIIVYDEK